MKTITIQVSMLARIDAAARKALARARKDGVIVKFEFNGHTVTVSPDDTEADVERQYFSLLDQKPSTTFMSPEEIAELKSKLEVTERNFERSKMVITILVAEIHDMETDYKSANRVRSTDQILSEAADKITKGGGE